MHKFPSPITEVISSNEESEQLPVIVHVDFTILNWSKSDNETWRQ